MEIKGKTASSMHDIASLLRVAPSAPVQEPPLPEGKSLVVAGDEPDTDAAPEEGDDAEEELYANGEAPEQDDDEDDAEAGDDDADAEPEEDDEGYFAVNDDDMIEVKIDGEIQLRSIADAKKALSGEGAIDKRLKEATEARKQANSAHSQLLEQFSVAHNSLMKTVQNLEGVIFKPTVERPDAALRQSNPQKYLLAVDAYEADQKRVEQGQKAVRDMVSQQRDALQNDIQEYRQSQAQLLVERMPELNDPQKAAPLLQGLSKLAIERYGYTVEEVQQASDHRMYLMMHDLMKFHEARSSTTRKGNTVKNLEGQSQKTPRKLRSGGTTAKMQTRKSADARKKVTDQARQSGKVKDVAATLIGKR
jgi:hypothetical protein